MGSRSSCLVTIRVRRKTAWYRAWQFLLRVLLRVFGILWRLVGGRLDEDNEKEKA